jgi:hypothetical protein
MKIQFIHKNLTPLMLDCRCYLAKMVWWHLWIDDLKVNLMKDVSLRLSCCQSIVSMFSYHWFVSFYCSSLALKSS